MDAFAATHVEVWAAPLANGDVSLLTLNPTHNDTIPVAVNVSQVLAALGLPPIKGLKAARDIGAREAVAPLPGLLFDVPTPPHGARFLRLTPS